MMVKRVIALLMTVLVVMTSSSCSSDNKRSEPEDIGIEEKNGEIYTLVTSDVHCGVSEGFGYAGLYQIREVLERSGYTTLLVDDGDSVQGDHIGTLTKGEAGSWSGSRVKGELGTSPSEERISIRARYIRLPE